MKTNETIKSRTSLVNRANGRAYGIVQLQTAMVILAAASVWGYTPAARAEGEFSCATDAASQALCDPTPGAVPYSFNLPEIGGLLLFETPGSFVERPGLGTANLTGVVKSWNDPTIEYDVELTFSGRLNPGDVGSPPPGSPVIKLTTNFCPFSPENWHYYTSLTGTLTGRTGSPFDGAVYSITLRTAAAQVGEGANNRNLLNGLWADLLFEVSGTLPDPNLPIGPFEGGMNLAFATGCSLPPVVDVTGTWSGTIECAGFGVDIEAVAQEQLSTGVVLKFGNQSGFSQYSVELTENSTVDTFCGQITNNRDSDSTAQGGLVDVYGVASAVFAKFAEVDLTASPNPTGTMRARQIRVTPEGAMLCKWSFTLTNAADPTITDNCTP